MVIVISNLILARERFTIELLTSMQNIGGRQRIVIFS